MTDCSALTPAPGAHRLLAEDRRRLVESPLGEEPASEARRSLFCPWSSNHERSRKLDRARARHEDQIHPRLSCDRAQCCGAARWHPATANVSAADSGRLEDRSNWRSSTQVSWILIPFHSQAPPLCRCSCANRVPQAPSRPAAHGPAAPLPACAHDNSCSPPWWPVAPLSRGAISCKSLLLAEAGTSKAIASPAAWLPADQHSCWHHAATGRPLRRRQSAPCETSHFLCPTTQVHSQQYEAPE